MLVLSRKVGQQIRIGNSVVVTLLKVERNRARLGVDAPTDVPVLRQELLSFAREFPAEPAPNEASPVNRSGASAPRPERARTAPRARCLWETAAVH